LKASWAEALKRENWAQVAYFLQLAEEKKLIPRDVLPGMRAVALASAGAQGEALLQVAELADKRSGGERDAALRTLIAYYASTFAREKLQEHVKALHKTNPGLAIRLRAGIKWADEKETKRAPASS